MTLSSHRRVNQCLCFAILTTLSACAWITPVEHAVTADKSISQTIGPFPTFSGRLIVINPSRRWQVEIDWQSFDSEAGKLRLNHAFSSTVVDFRWNNTRMEVRDNNAPYWRTITEKELAELGIMLPPKQLANILLGKMPSHFHQKKSNMWESKQSGTLIRLLWQAEQKKLTISDIQHGRVAKLIIQ